MRKLFAFIALMALFAAQAAHAITGRELAGWTEKACAETFTFSHDDWKERFAANRGFYNANAWDQLEGQLAPLIEAITREKVSLRAEAGKATDIRPTKEGWIIAVPLTVFHMAKVGRIVKIEWLAIILVRMDENGPEIVKFRTDRR